MKKQIKRTFVIGSSVCDVIIRVHQMPKQTEDQNIIQQDLSMGGCAYNVAHILKHFDVPYTLFSPIGTGIYGDFVKEHFYQEEIPIVLETSQKNGCCYCIVDDSGERTFICEHGAEYFYQDKWFKEQNGKEYQQVYICGLEIEETTGDIIIDFLEQNPHLQIFFAPGPRIHYINHNKMQRIFKLHPILHLNESEILTYTKQKNLTNATQTLFKETQQVIIVTLGHKGCYFYDGVQGIYIPGVQTTIIDTIGAGDSHIGTIIACQAIGLS